MMLKKEKLDLRVLSKLKLRKRKSDFKKWEKIVSTINNLKGKVEIGIVGKYTKLKDAYISIFFSLAHFMAFIFPFIPLNPNP